MSSNTLVETNVLQTLLDPRVRTLVASYLEDWMFTDPVHQLVLEAIKRPRFDGVQPDVRSFVVEVSSVAKLDRDETRQILDLFKDFTPFDNPSEVVPALREYIRDKKLARGIKGLADSGSTNRKRDSFVELIKDACTFDISEEEFVDFSDIEQARAAKEEDYPEGGVIMKSSLKLINACSTYGGYKFGDLAMYAAGPGVGKTTLLLQESGGMIEQGFNVCHVFLGDMSEFDGLLKLLSLWSKMGSKEVLEVGWEDVYYEYRHYFKHIRLKAFPADTYNVYELVAKLNGLYEKFPFQWCAVDYDANIKDASPTGDNLYAAGGITYANLKNFAKGRCAVGVGSQTKIGSWGNEMIQKSDAAESSKKQQHIDFMVGIGKNPECKTVGTVNLPKVRRGISDSFVRVELRNDITRLIEVNEEKYNTIISVEKSRKEAGGTEFDYDDLFKGLRPEGDSQSREVEIND